MNVAFTLSIFAVHIVALISPGPDFTLCLKNAVSFGKKAGLFTALGFAIGVGIHTTYMLFGFDLLQSYLPLVLKLMKWCGAAYLCYLGISGLFAFFKYQKESANAFSAKVQKIERGNLACFGDGLLTNLLNPKAVIFFVSVFAVIQNNPVNTLNKIVLIIGMAFLTFCWFGFIAFMLNRPLVLQKLKSWNRAIIGISSLVLLIFGLSILFA